MMLGKHGGAAATDRPRLGLYLHIPFCRHRCSYCDFNAYAGLDDLIAPYTAALANEVRWVAAALPPAGALKPATVDTIYFGGGTPSTMPLESLAGIMAAVRGSFVVAPDCEVTLEANPGTVDLDYLEGLHILGVTRLSLGVQSAQPGELALFSRVHSFDQAVQAVGLARRAGFSNVNLDLIYGIPGQTLDRWQDTVARNLALEPDHLSLYALSLEFGTPMKAWVGRGLLPEPDSGLAADMYHWAHAELTRAGLVQYEISNWARHESQNGIAPTSNPAFACRHNLGYWRNGAYLGFGAGAHGCVPRTAAAASAGGWRYANVRSPTAYVKCLQDPKPMTFPLSPALAERLPVDLETEMAETLMLGLRLTREGVNRGSFEARFGVDLEDAFGPELRELGERDLLQLEADTVRLTPGGRLVANWVFEKFV